MCNLYTLRMPFLGPISSSHDAVVAHPSPLLARLRSALYGGAVVILALSATSSALAQNNGDNAVVGDTSGNAAVARTNTGTIAANAVSGNNAVQVILQPALDEVRHMIGSLDTGHWKAPGPVRSDVDRNVASIQRDLETTLPGLIATASAAPGSAAASFAVYRNVDALYDVLLRVEQTAELAAPDKEAGAVSSALEKLESSRHQLGDAIAAWAQNQESDLTRLRTEAHAAAAAAAQAPPPAKDAVVEDGPAPAAKPKRKKKPAAQTAPAPQTPAPQQN